MIPEAAYQVAIGALLTVIGILWKLHLDGDTRERTESAANTSEWKTIAKSLTADVGDLGDALSTRNRIDEELIRAGAK